METKEALESQDNNIYYPEVDWCKGFAIILMVLGHVFTCTQNTEIEKMIQIIIYDFHMLKMDGVYGERFPGVYGRASDLFLREADGTKL